MSHGKCNALLAKFGLTAEDLLAEVPEIGSDDVIMLVGSVSDGLATSLSDIDIMVAGERRPDSDLILWESDRQRAIRRLDSGQEINIEYWDWDRLKMIAGKFSDSAYAINNPTLTDDIIVFDEEEVRIIHYILNGIVLSSGEKLIFDEIFDKDSFLDYLVMFSATKYLATAEDSIGQIMEADVECASFDLRRAFEFLIGAELASHGYTNPAPRWRMKLLRSAKAELGDEVYERYMSYLFCGPDKTRLEIEEALRFGQDRLGAIFMRRPKVFAAAGALGERMKFVTSFQA
ncbi:MAG: nucleotidyltransferase domain-containing protein [Sphingomonadales bacterium]|nr:nucleotidyltransferase domain-containing protein [Sphingomonadales bacterium]